MDKYGVDTTDNQDTNKIASEIGKCPKCGDRLDVNSPTPRCPTHGTYPFEKGASER
jgi:ssDNA-binding Zn-finger/Zn-ribbon topoisomerase 1